MAGPNMKRDQSLAGQSVKQGNYTVTYDQNGYATSARRDNGASATHTVQTTHANDSSAHQEAYQAAQRGDWDAVGVAINKVGMQSPNQYGGYDMAAANQYMQELQNQFGYNANDYYRGQYDSVYGAGAWDGGTGTGKPVYNKYSQNLVNNYNKTQSSAVGGAVGGAAGKVTGGSLAGGNTTGSTGGYGSFQEFLNGVGYNDYTEQTRKYIQAAVDNAINGYNRQIDTVNEDTKELARQAYIANMLGQKNMDQQLSASGLAGGMADSQRIGLQANYENSLNELEMQRQATIAELQLAIENARLTGDMQTAQELAGYLQQVQSQWVNYMQNQQQMENQNYWNNLNLQQENRNTARNWALTMLQSGAMPDEETLTAAGMTAAEAQTMLNYVRQQNAPRYTAPVVEPVETEEDRLIAAISAYSQMGDTPLSENEVRSLWNSNYDFSSIAAEIPALQQYYLANGEVPGINEEKAEQIPNKIIAEVQSRLMEEGYSADRLISILDTMVARGRISENQAVALGAHYGLR